MATTPAWNDVGHLGRALNRNFRFLETLSKKEIKKKTPDVEHFININNSMANTSLKLAKLIEMFDAMPRIKNLEKLIENIPPHVLAETKAKLGM